MTLFKDALHHAGVFDDKFWIPPSSSAANSAERSDDTSNKKPMAMSTVPPRLRRMRSESIQAGTKGGAEGFFGGPSSQDDGAVSPS